MDDADRAQDRIENTVSDAIREARRAHGMKPTGFCLYCGEGVPQHYLFCCSDCSKDWHHEQARKKANGV